MVSIFSASYEYYFIKVHENLVQHPSNNKSIKITYMNLDVLVVVCVYVCVCACACVCMCVCLKETNRFIVDVYQQSDLPFYLEKVIQKYGLFLIAKLDKNVISSRLRQQTTNCLIAQL